MDLTPKVKLLPLFLSAHASGGYQVAVLQQEPLSKNFRYFMTRNSSDKKQELFSETFKKSLIS